MNLIYTAGKYRAKTEYEVWVNIQTADYYGAELIKKGFFPVIPHKNTAFFGGLKDDKFFLDGTLEMLRRCDSIFMLPDWESSEGARNEHAEAQKLGLKIYYDLEEL